MELSELLAHPVMADLTRISFDVADGVVEDVTYYFTTGQEPFNSREFEGETKELVRRFESDLGLEP